MDSDSALANVLEVLVPTIGIAIVVGSAVVAGLKGRLWMTVIGIVGAAAAFIVLFGAFDVPEPSAEFRETLGFRILNAGLVAAGGGGLLLWVLGAALPARPGTWWERHRAPAA